MSRKKLKNTIKLIRIIDEKEKEIFIRSNRFFRKDPYSRAALDYLSFSLGVILHFCHAPTNVNRRNYHIAQLSYRFYNDVHIYTRLLRAGYYQSSMSILRDIMEVGNLIKYLSTDRKLIESWALADKEDDRLEKFSPKKIRDKLVRLKLLDSGCHERYAHACGYGSHASSISMNLYLCEKGTLKWGPFYDEHLLSVDLHLAIDTVNYGLQAIVDYFGVQTEKDQLIVMSVKHLLLRWMEAFSEFKDPAVFSKRRRERMKKEIDSFLENFKTFPRS